MKMAFLKRRRRGIRQAKVKVADVYVVTSMIISSNDDGTGRVHKCINMYFLAKCKDGEYYELFFGKKLEKERQPKDGFLLQKFDIPYVKKAEPLKKYLKNQNKVTIDAKSLFDFITLVNAWGNLDAFLDEEDEATSKEC